MQMKDKIHRNKLDAAVEILLCVALGDGQWPLIMVNSYASSVHKKFVAE